MPLLAWNEEETEICVRNNCYLRVLQKNSGKFAASVGRIKAKRLSTSGGLRPLTP